MAFSLFRKWSPPKIVPDLPWTGPPNNVKPRVDDSERHWLMPPRDVHDPECWNRFWQDQVGHGLSPFVYDMCCRDAPLIAGLRRRGSQTILCAGCGISQEPRALAAAGFHVTALDLSPVALSIAESWDLSPKHLDWYCGEEQRVVGGCIVFVVGDIMDGTSCPGPFDAIIERRTLQLFPEQERGRALEALAARLSGDGLFVSHTHDGGWRPPAKRAHATEALFRERDWQIHSGVRQVPEGRVACLVTSTG